MEKLQVENSGFEAYKNPEIHQLIRIARLELERPLEGCKTLVFGEGATAQALCEALNKKGAVAKQLTTVEQLQEDNEQFTLALILNPIPHRVLENLMAVQGVAIDANPQRSGEWVVHDKALAFKRIRVLSMICK